MPALIVDPALQAEVIRQFNLRGELAPFNLTENVVPVFDIGKLVSTVVPTEVVSPSLNNFIQIGLPSINDVLRVGPTDFASTEIVTDSQAAPAAATVLADSGALTAGRKAMFGCMGHNDNAPILIDLEWRNAANTANVHSLPFVIVSEFSIAFTVNVAASERFRWIATGAVAGQATSFISFPAADTTLAT